MASAENARGHDDDDLEPGAVRVAADGTHTVVWLSGEHDLATVGLIGTALVEALAVDRCDVVVDLSEVAFIDASTLGALVHGRELLASRGRRLTVRSPPRSPRRVLELCGLAALIEATSSAGTAQDHGAATALGTWVEVPPSAPLAGSPPPDQRDSARAGPERSVDEHAVHPQGPEHAERSGSGGQVGR